MISLSSGEAESYAESACAAKLLGLAELVKEPHSTVPVNYETDTRFSTIRTSETNTRRSKHIEVRCLAIRSWIRDRRFAVGHVHAKNNTADILTKYLDGPLTPSLFQTFGKTRDRGCKRRCARRTALIVEQGCEYFSHPMTTTDELSCGTGSRNAYQCF